MRGTLIQFYAEYEKLGLGDELPPSLDHSKTEVY
jgi:hypothetical protein